MAQLIDLSGQRFHRLTVVARVANSRHGNARWLCRCECGAQVEVAACNLKSGHSKSCGCLRREFASARRWYKHGHATSSRRSPEYRSWTSMRARCNYSGARGFMDYGGRGISVCERWNSFELFLADMGPKPSPQHSIDRIDPDGDYEPGNCRWATSKEQATNKRRDHDDWIGAYSRARDEWIEWWDE